MEEILNLYQIELKGMHGRLGGNVEYGTAYVVATDTVEAYRVVRNYLNENTIGFSHDRELLSITLLATTENYPPCGTKLYMGK
jgi:hypothetical protein